LLNACSIGTLCQQPDYLWQVLTLAQHLFISQIFFVKHQNLLTVTMNVLSVAVSSSLPTILDTCWINCN